jgi:hypothetical protein
MLTGKIDQKSNNELQNTKQKMSVKYAKPTQKSEMNSGAAEG